VSGSPEASVQVWVAKNQLTLLLDGLDEVKKKEGDRAACEQRRLIPRTQPGSDWPVMRSREAD